MPNDRYSNFKDLSSSEAEGKDYQIICHDRDSRYLIIAPHGGKIEPGTSQIAHRIAGSDKSLYLFEGLRPDLKHHELHITSHLFDEPRALAIAAKSDLVVAIHGRADGDDSVTVWMGGRDGDTASLINLNLQKAGFASTVQTGKLSGRHRNNICNRGRTGRGVQLEIPRSLRRKLLREDRHLALFSDTIEAALAGG